LITLEIDSRVMSRLVPIAHFPLVLAAVFISFGSVVPERAAAEDQGKGAECAPLDDPAARLACFDAAFPWPPRTSPPIPAAAAAAPDEPGPPIPAAAAVAPDEPSPPKPAAAAVAPNEPVSEAQKFGLSTKQRAALEAKPAEPAPTETTAAVKTVRRLASGYLLIGLDNDQVWQQSELDSLIRLQPGDQVTIRRASMGSHLLVTPGKYSTRVRRIQ
jgi:hypothetical protein